MYVRPQMHIDCPNYQPRLSHAEWGVRHPLELLCVTLLRFRKHQLIPG